MAHSLVCQLPSDQERRYKESMIINSLNLNIYSSSLSKTDQIMSRYRPIAPKPQQQPSSSMHLHHHHPHPILDSSMSSPPPQKAQRPRPFLRNISPHLQTRTSRGCRKRTKAGGFPPWDPKRSTRTPLLEFSSSPSHPPPLHAASSSSSSSPLADNSLLLAQVDPVSRAGILFHGELLEKPTNALTLPLLPHPSTAAPAGALTRSLPAAKNYYYYYYSQFDDEEEVLLNLKSPITELAGEDHYLLQKQKLPAPPLLCCSKVISPQPVRPIGSSIRVGLIIINEDPASSTSTSCGPKRPEEVEEEVESEVLPAVVSDSNNRVRVVNSAYKEMVGQPECSWLDATYIDAAAAARGVTTTTRTRRQGSGACKRMISGEVMLHLSDPGALPPPASHGFSCNVRIEWERSDGKKTCIYAPCDVIRLSCLSKDYLFTWRFHTSREASTTEF